MKTKEARTVLSPELVRRIDAVGRKAVAIQMGVPYSTLNNKCSGYCTVCQDEVEAIEKAISELQDEVAAREAMR